MTKDSLCKKLLTNFTVFFMFFVLCILQIQIYAQRVTPGAAPGTPAGTVSLSDIDNINYFTGRLNISIPVTTLGGRGEAGLPYSIQLEQTSWTQNYIIQEPTDNRLFFPERKNRHDDTAVFNNVYGGVPSMETIQSWYGEYENCSNGQWAQKTLTFLQFTAPNGTKYDLRDQIHNGRINDVGFCGHSWGNYYNRGTIFKSSDGSAATFISDQAVSDYLFPYQHNDPPPTGYLHLRDGMTYRFESGKFMWMRDRNGNLVSQVTTNNNGVLSEKLVDSLNREITFPESGQPNIQTVRYKGFGGNDRNVNVHWGTLGSSLRLGQSLKTYLQLFPQMNYSPDTIFNLQVISKIVLPDNTEYKLYYNSYGDIARIELPTGAAVEYDWLGAIEGGSNEGGSGGERDVIFRRVVERRFYADGINLSQTMVIGRVNLSQNVDITIDTYGTSLISRTKHFYYGNPLYTSSTYPYFLYSSWKEGKEYQTQIFAENGTTLLRQTNQTWQQRAPVSWWAASPDSAPQNDPRVVETTTLLADSNQVSKQTFAYDSFNNLTDTYEYDYGIGAPEQFLRRSHTDYLTTNIVNNIDYTGNSIHILGLPSQTWVSSDLAGSNRVSLMQFEYDNYTTDQNHAALLDRQNISGHDSAFGTNFETRGNVTKIKSFADATNQTGEVSSYRQYDIAGNSIKGVDAKGYANTLVYSDRFGSPDAEARSNSAPAQLNGQQTFAFATSATNAAGYTTYAQFDYYSGRGVDGEDINGNVSTTYSNNDLLDRPTQIIFANNRSLFKKQTTFIYDDLARKVTVTSDSKTFGDNLIKAESFYDKSGRTTKSRQYETPTTYIETQQEYDALGRAYKSSNPFRPQLNESPQWTTTTFDALGRVKTVITPDNSVVSRSYLGTTTTVTDQALRKRSGTTDAIGRLLKVNEDPNGLNYETTYQYDVLGRLRKTTQTEGQTTQNRYFMYNDLGRLIRAKQPEQIGNTNLPAITDPTTENSNWSVAYSYDDNGNIVSTTDANNRTVSGVYDNLNRLTFRDYSETSMPDATFTFDDPTILNSKGQLTAVTTNVSSTLYTSFDELGRVKSSRQSTNGQTYNMPNYTYDLSGALVAQTYPSMRVVTTETDNIGRLSRVLSQMPNQSQRTYAGNLSYTSFGAVEKMRLGNGTWESAQFDSKRLQVKQIGLGASSNDTSYLKLDYDYGTSDNNGNLRQQKITVQGMSAQLIQNYGYDSLNRLQSATENVNGNPTPTWKQTFSYDRFGNRRFDANNTTTLLANNAVYNPNIDQANNRFTVSEGYNYDNEGNLTGNPESQLFAYDAENHQTQVQSSAGTANYYYDGSGKRVRKVVGSQETVFVYDAFGKMVAEYTINQTVTTDGTKYLTTDALGSPRAITDNSGHVVSRHDYLPFGEEVTAGIGGRTDPQGYKYNGDGVKQQFTGYERDAESGLDYAQARYFSSKHGRFTSIDPLTASASIKNPQTFNRYSYGLNSPYKFTDSLGLKPCAIPGGGSTGCIQEGDDCPECKPFSLPVSPNGDGKGIFATVQVNGVDSDSAVPLPMGAGMASTMSVTARQPIPLPLLLRVSVPLAVMAGADALGRHLNPKYMSPMDVGALGADALQDWMVDITAQAIPDETTLAVPTTTTADPPRLDGNLVIVRGGVPDLPRAGNIISGAFGASVPDAAAFVPHGTIRVSTVQDIIDTGGSVVPVPEMTRGGNMNYRHVNIVEGLTSTFGPPRPNPVPSKLRIQ